MVGDSGETAPVLSVSSDGVKISNIQAAIDYAISKLQGETNDEIDTVEESVGLASDGSYVPKEGSNYCDSATTVEGEIAAIDAALKAVSDKLNNVSVVESGSAENWVSLSVEEVEPGKTGLTLDDSALAEELLDIREDIEAETDARENADMELLGSTASTSAETSIWGVKKLIANLTTTLVKDVTVPTGETLIEVTKEDTLEGDLYTVSSSDRLNTAVDLAEASVQDVAFAAVAEKDASAFGSNVGAEIVPADGGEGSLLKLDLSNIKIDCGEY